MATIMRDATAVWTGAGKDGRGTLTTQSATLKETPYSFTTRFGDGKGTNPEELIAAAHAGCFSMALAFGLSGAGHPPERLHHQGGPVDRAGRRRLAHQCGDAQSQGQGAGDRARRIPQGGRGRKGELPGLQGAQRRDHAQGGARGGQCCSPHAAQRNAGLLPIRVPELRFARSGLRVTPRRYRQR